MDAFIDWFAARAVAFGAIAIIIYVITPPKRFRKGEKHAYKK